MKKETPRTDEHLRWRRENGYVAIITQDFARQLEIELAEARAEIERLRRKEATEPETKFGHLIDEATKTPRTDKAAFVAEFGGPVVVDADFARELEKELAAAKAKLRDMGAKK